MLASAHLLLGTKLTVPNCGRQDREDFQVWIPDSCGSLEQHKTNNSSVHIDYIGDIYVPTVPLRNKKIDYLRKHDTT